MARTVTLTPSCKQCRTEGEKLFLKGDRCHTTKCAIVKRKYRPGQHGIKHQPRLSEYGMQLRAKQKAKRLYGVMERQFSNYYKKAVARDDSALGLKSLLEMRLDNVIYRLGLAVSRAQARQMVSHEFFLVNGKKMNIASYQVKVGDEITIREKSKNSPLFKDLSQKLEHQQLPSWLNVDTKTLDSKVLSNPTNDDLRGTIDAKNIIEFYSRF